MKKSLIKQILQDSKIGLIDVGSSGGLEPRWSDMDEFLTCFMFEPDERSYLDIADEVNKRGWTIYPTALSSKTDRVNLYLCRKPQVSSLYLPNRQLLDLFPNESRWDVIKTIEINVDSFDNLIQDSSTREKCDFIKLDVQGYELSVLQGAVETLDYVLGIECEVEFIKIYENQPLFGNVCEFLDKLGFSFTDFVSLHKWSRSNYIAERGQLIFADALFLKPPEIALASIKKQFSDDNQKAKSKLKRYICICILYEKNDYVQFILDNYSEEFNLHHEVALFSRLKNKRLHYLRNFLKKVFRKISRFIANI